jgi:rod shape-determining protein MreD
MNALFIILTLPVLAALQARLPSAWWLGGLRLELLPALVVYAALTLRRNGAIAFAFVAGFLQDSLSAGPFGLHAAVYASITVVLTGMHEMLDRELPGVQIGSGALMTASASLAACTAAGFPAGCMLKLIILTVFSTLITPVLFLALDALRYLLRRES